MDELIHADLKQRFRQFREVYLREEVRQREAGASGWHVANEPYKAALREVLLTPDELRLYKKLVAMQSVNGGTLFPDLDREK